MRFLLVIAPDMSHYRDFLRRIRDLLERPLGFRVSRVSEPEHLLGHDNAVVVLTDQYLDSHRWPELQEILETYQAMHRVEIVQAIRAELGWKPGKMTWAM